MSALAQLTATPAAAPALPYPSALGETLAGYEARFDFAASDYVGRAVLDVGAGASSFVAEAVRRGMEAIGVDPLYTKPVETLRTYGRMDLAAARRTPGARDLTAPAEALRRFLEDYPGGRGAGRYLGAALPDIPLRNHRFDLVLCGAVYFVRGATPPSYAHLFTACRELCRLARGEVRIAPFDEVYAEETVDLARLYASLKHLGIKATLRDTSAGNRMLVLRRDLPFT